MIWNLLTIFGSLLFAASVLSLILIFVADRREKAIREANAPGAAQPKPGDVGP